MNRTILRKLVGVLGRPGTWVVAGVLAAPVVLTGVGLRGDESPVPAKPAASSLAAADMLFRGAELATAGQRFTLEILMLVPKTLNVKTLRRSLEELGDTLNCDVDIDPA